MLSENASEERCSENCMLVSACHQEINDESGLVCG